jgi:hypothetical protein
MSPAAYLGRTRPWCYAPQKFWDCGCGGAQLVRISRATWMRLIPGTGQYYCRCCGSAVLRPKLRQRVPYESVYLAAPPLRCDRDSIDKIVVGALDRLSRRSTKAHV